MLYCHRLRNIEFCNASTPLGKFPGMAMRMYPVLKHPRFAAELRAGYILIAIRQRIKHYSRNALFSLTMTIYGAVAQLGECLHGMQEVEGSSPSSSTKLL